MNRKAIVFKKDINNLWSVYYEGYIVAVSGVWVKVKRKWWNRGEWLPVRGSMVQVSDVRESNIGTIVELPPEKIDGVEEFKQEDLTKPVEGFLTYKKKGGTK